MVLAYHLILSFYGFWLPNDERGSWSQRVRKIELQRFGPATKVNTRQSRANQPFNAERRQQMREALNHPALRINGTQAREVAKGFAKASAEADYRVLACAIMPNHVHLVIAKHQRSIETIAAHLKSRATQQLNIAELNPLPRSPWAKGHWVVYLNSDPQVRHAIRYANNNPIKDGLKPQHWKFVKPFPV